MFLRLLRMPSLTSDHRMDWTSGQGPKCSNKVDGGSIWLYGLTLALKSDSLRSKLCHLLAVLGYSGYMVIQSLMLFIWIIWIIFPRWLRAKESTCQCRRCRVDSCIGKISWRRKWQLTPVFLPKKFHAWWRLEGYSLWGHKNET